jgi:hypothetical protein
MSRNSGNELGLGLSYSTVCIVVHQFMTNYKNFQLIDYNIRIDYRSKMKATPSLSGGAQLIFMKQLNFVSNAWKKISCILMEFQSKNREPVIMKWKFSINIFFLLNLNRIYCHAEQNLFSVFWEQQRSWKSWSQLWNIEKPETLHFLIEQCEHIFRVGLPNVVVLMYFVHLE